MPYFAFISMSPGPGEMIFIFLAMLLMFGAKNLPKIARNLGRTMEEFRRAAHDVTSEIMNADDDDPASYTPPTALPPVQDDQPDMDTDYHQEVEDEPDDFSRG